MMGTTPPVCIWYRRWIMGSGVCWRAAPDPSRPRTPPCTPPTHHPGPPDGPPHGTRPTPGAAGPDPNAPTHATHPPTPHNHHGPPQTHRTTQAPPDRPNTFHHPYSASSCHALMRQSYNTPGSNMAGIRHPSNPSNPNADTMRANSPRAHPPSARRGTPGLGVNPSTVSNRSRHTRQSAA